MVRTFVAVYLSLFIALSDADSGSTSRFANYASCTKICHCSYDAAGKVWAKCNVAREVKTGNDLHLPPDIQTL